MNSRLQFTYECCIFLYLWLCQNTITVTKSKLYHMYHLHKDVISVKNLSQWLTESKHFMKPVIIHICYYHLWNKKATAIAWAFWILVIIGDTFQQQNCIVFLTNFSQHFKLVKYLFTLNCHCSVLFGYRFVFFFFACECICVCVNQVI